MSASGQVDQNDILLVVRVDPAKVLSDMAEISREELAALALHHLRNAIQTSLSLTGYGVVIEEPAASASPASNQPL